MTDYIEPLPADIWFRQIEKIALGEFAKTENALRHMSHLLQLAPEDFRRVVRLEIGEDRFEALLEAGDLDTAARVLIAEPASLAVRHDLDGKSFRATITCFETVFCGKGTSKAAAILHALATGLLTLKSGSGTDLVRGARQCLHTDRPAQGQRLS